MWKMCVCVRDKWVHQQTMTLRGRYWEITVSVSRWKNVNYGPNLKTLQAPLEWLLHSFKKHSLMGTSILVPTVSEVPLTWLCKHNDVPIGIVIQAHAHTHTKNHQGSGMKVTCISLDRLRLIFIQWKRLLSDDRQWQLPSNQHGSPIAKKSINLSTATYLWLIWPPVAEIDENDHIFFEFCVIHLFGKTIYQILPCDSRLWCWPSRPSGELHPATSKHW